MIQASHAVPLTHSPNPCRGIPHLSGRGPLYPWRPTRVWYGQRPADVSSRRDAAARECRSSCPSDRNGRGVRPSVLPHMAATELTACALAAIRMRGHAGRRRHRIYARGQRAGARVELDGQVRAVLVYGWCGLPTPGRTSSPTRTRPDAPRDNARGQHHGCQPRASPLVPGLIGRRGRVQQRLQCVVRSHLHLLRVDQGVEGQGDLASVVGGGVGERAVSGGAARVTVGRAV